MERPTRSKRQLKPRKIPSECLCCGEADPWVVNKVEFIAPFRDTEHAFRAEVHQCRHCDAISTTEEQTEAISAQVRDAHRKWISERLKTAQKELGLSLRELAEKSSIPFATLGRISSGEHLIEATMEKLLWMEIERLTDAHVMERLLKMKQHAFRLTNGSVFVKNNPSTARVYSGILKSAAHSPLGNSSDCGREQSVSKPSCSDLVFA
jgi:hypothetical protein